MACPAEAVRFAKEHGLPIAIKAAHGGGGRGLRVAREAGEVAGLFEAAVREAGPRSAAASASSRPTSSTAGTSRRKYWRTCTVTSGGGDPRLHLQRRYQKLVEEAPAPFLTEASGPPWNGRPRPSAGRPATSAPAVEFLLSPRGELSFLEVNTRLQVEHTVTEESADINLVRASC